MSHPYQPKLDKEKERVVQEFTVLRNEQRNLVTNISKLEVDLKEHKTVYDTLQAVEETRRCYRLVGGVLCARTVKEVLPELRANKDQLELMVKMGNEQLTKKGEELNKYIEENNIKFKQPEMKEDEVSEAAAEESAEATTERKQLLVTN